MYLYFDMCIIKVYTNLILQNESNTVNPYISTMSQADVSFPVEILL